MADDNVPDWPKIEASHWTDTIESRAEEDRVMVGKFESRTAPIKCQLTMMLDQREERIGLIMIPPVISLLFLFLRLIAAFSSWRDGGDQRHIGICNP
jgi:hypothetical protein